MRLLTIHDDLGVSASVILRNHPTRRHAEQECSRILDAKIATMEYVKKEIARDHH